MAIAILATWMLPEIVHHGWIILAIIAGAALGYPLAMVPLTAVPQRTALSHAFGGLAAGLVGTAKYYLESLEPKWDHDFGIENAFFVDCGLSYSGTPANAISGLGHLEGKAVAVLADGSPVEGLTVTSGAITLPYPASTVHVGLPYRSVLSPMPPEMDSKEGTTLGRARVVGKSRIRVLDTVGGKHGSDLAALDDFPYLPEDYDGPVEPYSGDLEFSPAGGLDSSASIWIVQDRPLPMTVVALMLEVDFEG